MPRSFPPAAQQGQTSLLPLSSSSSLLQPRRRASVHMASSARKLPWHVGARPLPPFRGQQWQLRAWQSTMRMG